MTAASAGVARGLFVIAAWSVAAVWLNAAAAEERYVFSRLAGVPNDSGFGSTDGFGETGRLNRPQSVAVDPAGNVYVADTGNHTIRKITPRRFMSTFAGTPGVSGNVDGRGTAARFNGLDGLAMGPDGNLYVADRLNLAIRRVTPEAVVSTIAVLEGAPQAIAIDRAGMIYFTQMAAGAIWRLSPDGAMTILAGDPTRMGVVDGHGTAARFGASDGIAVDAAGNVYVSEDGNHLLRKITPSGDVTTVAGMAGEYGLVDDTGAAARFGWPHGLATDASGNVYVADMANNAIRKVTTAAQVSTVAGFAGRLGSGDGTIDARFNGPRGVAVGPLGDVYVADTENSTVRRIAPDGVVSTFAGRAGGGGFADGPVARAQLRVPVGVAVDRLRNVYVSDSLNYAIRKISSAGLVTTVAGLPGVPGDADGYGATARFGNPAGLAIDRVGNLFVADRQTHRIVKIAPDGFVMTLAGAAGTRGSADGVGLTEASFSDPTDVAVNATGTVYVADCDNHTIRSISPDGYVTTLAGLAREPGTVDGIGSAARFHGPAAIAVDQAGGIYVLEARTGAVRKVTPEGVVSTLLGPDGLTRPSSARSWYLPCGIAVDVAGNVFVADTISKTIRRVAPDGTVLTIGGALQQEGDADGPGAEARFHGVAGIAVDEFGQLYVTDTVYNGVRKGTLRPATEPAFVVQPESVTAAQDQAISLNARAATQPAAALQWLRNGRELAGRTSATLTLSRIGPTDVGLYHAIAVAGSESASSAVAILGFALDAKTTATGEEILPGNFRHPNGNTIDQVLLKADAGAITADYELGQITRLSFIDIDGDIVQVELGGPGTLSLVLDGAGAPAPAEKYHQPDVQYVKGHPAIVIAGATEQTNVTVFSVGRATAWDPTGAYDLGRPIGPTNDPARNGSPLFQGPEPAEYDGIADLAYIAVLSSDGRFGGIRAANATFFADSGHTGIYAPGVEFTGPVYVGDVSAFGQATPVLVLGSAADVRITGGDLYQDNGEPVQLSGINQLRFTDGSDSHGNRLPAQANRAVLMQDGEDVTVRIVVRP